LRISSCAASLAGFSSLTVSSVTWRFSKGAERARARCASDDQATVGESARPCGRRLAILLAGFRPPGWRERRDDDGSGGHDAPFADEHWGG
jgi:hypothetical protein